MTNGNLMDNLFFNRKKTFIISEAGVNHNGNIKNAKKLIDIASKAGSDAVKFQTFKSEGVVTNHCEAAEYAEKNIGKKIKQIDLIKNLELSYDDFYVLKDYCDKKNIMFLSTPHSFDAIDFLDDLVPAYKFGSGDLTNIPSLEYAAKKGKPMILGTGMSTLSEVKEAIESIKKTGNNNIIALHCTTNYPCPLSEVNMNALKTMQRELDCLIGYSDHTMGITIPIVAVSLGAVLIEKHFTIDRRLPGPDHRASLEPNELKNMISEIRNVEKAMGKHEKKPTASEEKIMVNIRKSVVANTDIKRGEKIKEKMLTIKRPGTGIKPKEINSIFGKRIKRDIQKDEILLKEDIE